MFSLRLKAASKLVVVVLGRIVGGSVRDRQHVQGASCLWDRPHLVLLGTINRQTVISGIADTSNQFLFKTSALPLNCVST